MNASQIERLEELENIILDCGSLSAEQYAEWQALGALIGDE